MQRGDKPVLGKRPSTDKTLSQRLTTGVFHGIPAYLCAVVLLLVVLVGSVLFAVTVGSADLTLGQVYEVILFEWFHIGDPATLAQGAVHDIVWYIRLPRIVLGVAVGMGLATVGVVMQAVVQNPLADPYILGISSGASLGATAAILLGIGAFGSNSVGVCAFLGALGVSFAVIGLSHLGGRATPVKLVLAGVALSSVCSAISNFIVYVADDPGRFMTVTFWLMGSLAGAEWESNGVIVLVVLLAIAFFLTQSRTLNLMLLGDDTAITLGTNLRRYRQVYLVMASLVVGFVVYASGVIGFVGLMIPHVIRVLFGVDHRKLLPLSALAGGIFLVWADVVARTILPNAELPIGILISIVGAPAFVLLLVKKTYQFGGRPS